MAAGASNTLRRGQAAFLAGDATEAVRLCGLAAEGRPGLWQAHAWLGLALSEEGDLESALGALEAAAEGSGSSAVPWLFKGRVLIDHDRHEEAVEALEVAAERAPDNLHVPGYLALAKWAVDAHSGSSPVEAPRSDLAAFGAELWGRWLLLVEERFPGGPGTDYPVPHEAPRSTGERIARWRAARLLRRAEEHHAAGDADRAAALLDRAEALWPSEPETVELRVALHARCGDELLRRIEADPGDVDLRLETAEDLLEAGDPRRALSVLEPVPGLVESLDKGRLSWNAGLALVSGRAELDLGGLEEAKELLDRAVSLLPTEVEPSYFLGIALLRSGQRAAARQALVDVCRMDGEIGPMRLRELTEAITPP